MNPCDPCVWNVNSHGSQLTLMLHAGDILLGHVESIMVAECTKNLDEVCGLIDLLNVTREKYHELLVMNLDFESIENSCVITHYGFIKKTHNLRYNVVTHCLQKIYLKSIRTQK